MSDYLKAYRARMERNDTIFKEIATELTKRGFTVWRNRGDNGRFISLLVIEKDGKHCNFSFSDVPYRWSIGISWNPNKETGSGRTVTIEYDGNGTDNLEWPFSGGNKENTIKTIESWMAPNPTAKMMQPETFLNKFS